MGGTNDDFNTLLRAAREFVAKRCKSLDLAGNIVLSGLSGKRILSVDTGEQPGELIAQSVPRLRWRSWRETSAWVPAIGDRYELEMEAWRNLTTRDPSLSDLEFWDVRIPGLEEDWDASGVKRTGPVRRVLGINGLVRRVYTLELVRLCQEELEQYLADLGLPAPPVIPLPVTPPPDPKPLTISMSEPVRVVVSRHQQAHQPEAPKVLTPSPEDSPPKISAAKFFANFRTDHPQQSGEGRLTMPNDSTRRWGRPE